MFWWMIATVCAFFVKGLCGFANTLIFTSILSFQNINMNISPVELILGYPTNMILAWKERKFIDWKMCLPLAFLVIAGSIPGALFLKNTDTGIVKMIFGVVVIFIGLEMLLREFQLKKMRQSKIALSISGILSGILCGMFGVGALLGAYVGRITDNSRAFKANICMVFLVENTVRIISYGLFGLITFDTCMKSFWLFPCMFLGLWIGIFSGKVINEGIAKKIVIFMLLISGVALVSSNCPLI